MPQTAQETMKRSRGFVGTLSAEDTARTKIKRTSMRAAKALLPRKENEMINEYEALERFADALLAFAHQYCSEETYTEFSPDFCDG